MEARLRWRRPLACYQRVNAAGITWAAARAAAEAARYESRAGHLVTVNSAEKNRFLTEHANLGAGALDRLELHWMGGYQLEGATEPRGGWAWVTGEPFGFANWSPAEPTDGGEDHALFDHGFNGNGKQWNDAPEDYSIASGYVIEFEAAAAPGQLRWAFPTGGQIMSCPAIGTDGTVYVGVVDGQVYALDGATGTQRWTFRALPKDANSPALGSNGLLYIGSSGRVYALEATSGQVRWKSPAGSRVWASPALGADGTVYAKSWDGLLSAHDGTTGTRRWHSPRLGYGSAGPVIGSGDSIFVSSMSDVYALDGTTGAVRWEFRADDQVETTPAVAADNTVYIISTAGTLHALDGATGAERWRFGAGSPVWASPALGADGTVYAGTASGVLYALDGGSALAPTPWPKFGGDAQNTGQALGAQPALERQPFRPVLAEGAEGRITVRFSGVPAPQIQWYFNGAPVAGGTNETLVFASVTRALEGRYWAAASNWLGQATSAPMVAVVSDVDPAYYPGWRWEGGGGAVQVLASPSIFGPWTPLFAPPAGATSGYYIETNLEAPSLYYQLRAEGGEATARFTATAHVPGWWYEEAVGTRHRIEYVWEGSGWTNWVELTELTLPATPFQFLDSDAFDHPRAVYRSTPVP